MRTEMMRPLGFDVTQPNPVTASLIARGSRDPAYCAANQFNIQYRVSPPNVWDQCLIQETDFWRAVIRAGGIGCVAKGERGRVYDPSRPPWIFMPPQSIRFQKVAMLTMAQILLPGVDYLVLQFQVPANYDAVIKSLTNIFVPTPGGMGLVEGSGDMIWRLQINSVWPKDYGNLITSQGDLANPHVLTGGGIRLKANSIVRYWVQVSPAGVGVLDPLGRVICICMGWNYPAE